MEAIDIRMHGAQWAAMGIGPWRWTKTTRLVAGLLVGLVAATGAWWAVSSVREAGRRAEISSRGAEVMPFDLERTTHVFKPLANGGVQPVVADDPRDGAQVELIRHHLRIEASSFRKGDFGDPVSIHGREMPGLAELEAGADRIDIRYERIPAGGRVWYQTADEGLVHAVHLWFEAQTSDHGDHAEMDS